MIIIIIEKKIILETECVTVQKILDTTYYLYMPSQITPPNLYMFTTFLIKTPTNFMPRRYCLYLEHKPNWKINLKSKISNPEKELHLHLY